MKIGDIEIKPVAKHFYCRYCETYDECRGSPHRSGLYFCSLIKYKNTRLLLYDGIGESEMLYEFLPVEAFKNKIRSGMSGCIEYESVYKTCGGWWYLKKPIIVEAENKKYKKISLSPAERTVYYDLLEKSAINVVIEIYKREPSFRDADWGTWERIRPLFYTWISWRTYQLPLGATLTFKPDSWDAEFTWSYRGKAIEFKVKKAKPEILEWRDHVEIRLGKRRIYYGIINGRRIAYYVYAGILAIGKEIYEDHEHPPCLIWWRDKPHFIHLMFYNRLGDIVFTREDDEDESILDMIYASEQHLEKVKVLRGELIKDEKAGIFKVKAPATLYHEEHGLLELPEGIYNVKLVPYSQRGHE